MPAKTKDGPETKGRPTLYKGIRMRSRLEADYAAMLDRDGQSWEYEPICFAADGVQWLPDFRINYTGEYEHIHRYIEVKPEAYVLAAPGGMRELVERADAILRRMSVVWKSEPEARLLLALHRYGRPWPDFEIGGALGEPWMCGDNLTPNSMNLIWPGMGQKEALLAAAQSALAPVAS